MAIADAVCKEHDKNLGSATALDSSKLKEADAILKLSKALGGKFLHFYVYGAVEGDTLVYYFTHPGILMEFDKKKEAILEEMKIIWIKEKLKKEVINFKKIRAALKPKPAPVKKEKEPYIDRATGNFKIHCKDAQLTKAFERIRERIKEGHDGV